MVIGEFYPFSTAPAPYDIVWCHFPIFENPDFPAEKARPGLIRQALQDQDGNAWVRVVYGTSKDPYCGSPFDFSIVTFPEMNVCGVKQATRFKLNREAELPWSKDWFSCLPGKPTPIIGHMPEYEVRKLQTQISWLQQRYQEWQQAQSESEDED